MVGLDGDGVTIEIERDDVNIVDPRESVVEYTTVFVDAEGVGEAVVWDFKVLVESTVDPLESEAV